MQYFGKDLEAMSFAKNYNHWIISEFEKYLDKNVAEIGAGTGNFTELLLEKKISKLIAIEPSNMYTSLQNKLGSIQNVETINDFFPNIYSNYSEFFDTIFYVNVLEHIENDLSELKCVYASLKSGGHVCIFVPALSWLYSDLDKQLGHIKRYYKKELVKLLQEAGFKIVKVKYFDIIGMLGWYILFVLLKKIPNQKNVSFYDTFVVSIMKHIERYLYLPMGKNLLIVGKK